MLDQLDTLERLHREEGREPPGWIEELRARALVWVDQRE
jgi:hypothetical protein